jgi:hypothetical protein
MEIEAAVNGKKMSTSNIRLRHITCTAETCTCANFVPAKRTRENLAKARKRQARQDNLDKTQIAAADRRNMSLDAYRAQKKQKQKQKRKTAGQATREKKERRKAKKAAGTGDAMEIE